MSGCVFPFPRSVDGASLRDHVIGIERKTVVCDSMVVDSCSVPLILIYVYAFTNFVFL